MKSHYTLTVVTDGTDIKGVMAHTSRLGVSHLTPLAAYEAATAISKHPAVLLVRCSFIQEKPEGVWRKGKHYQE